MKPQNTGGTEEETAINIPEEGDCRPGALQQGRLCCHSPASVPSLGLLGKIRQDSTCSTQSSLRN